MESHGASMVPKGDASLLGPPQKSTMSNLLNNSIIKSEYREAELWFLQHDHHPLDDKDTILCRFLILLSLEVNQ